MSYVGRGIVKGELSGEYVRGNMSRGNVLYTRCGRELHIPFAATRKAQSSSVDSRLRRISIPVISARRVILLKLPLIPRSINVKRITE